MPDVRELFKRLADEASQNALSDEELARERVLSTQALREERLEGVRGVIPDDDYARLVTGDLKQTDALMAIKRWHETRPLMKSPFSMMVLLGEPSRGKTLAAGWLLAEVGGFYITAEELRRLYRGYGVVSEARLDRLLKSRCLVVDDVGTELEEESAQSAIFEVVNRRQGLHRGWTVFTGNITTQEFAMRYGDRTVRRIQHQGAFAEVGGPDLRRSLG